MKPNTSPRTRSVRSKESHSPACCQVPGGYEQLVPTLAELFHHLSDPCRLKLLLILSQGEHAVGTLAAHLGVTSSAISHQLKTLRQARLVAFRREGQTLYYRLDDNHVKQLVDMGREHVMEKKD